MQQWEYLRVMWYGHHERFGFADNVIISVSDGRLGGDRKNAYRLQDGHKESKLSVSEMDTLFTELGAQGWELVNVGSVSNVTGQTGSMTKELSPKQLA